MANWQQVSRPHTRSPPPHLHLPNAAWVHAMRHSVTHLDSFAPHLHKGIPQFQCLVPKHNVANHHRQSTIQFRDTLPIMPCPLPLALPPLPQAHLFADTITGVHRLLVQPCFLRLTHALLGYCVHNHG